MAGKSTAQTRTLRRALEIVGSEERLAKLLGAERERLIAWISGDRATPNEIYLRALDIVSQGPGGLPQR